MPYKDKQEQLESQRLWRKERRRKIDEIKDVPCLDCGCRFPPECMDFDHLKDKIGNISKMSTKNNWDDVLLEIEKCEVICANCHRMRSRKRT